MVVAGFVAPYLLDTTMRFVEAAARLPGVKLALITCEPEDRLPPGLQDSLAGHWRIEDGLDPGQIAGAVQGLGEQLGPVQRLLAVLEQLQVPLAQVREHLGIAGMDVVTAGNFRDKAQMKTVLRAAGVPCARYRLASSAADADDFAKQAGFPLVVKPPAGAGAKRTSASTTRARCWPRRTSGSARSRWRCATWTRPGCRAAGSSAPPCCGSSASGTGSPTWSGTARPTARWCSARSAPARRAPARST